MSILEEKIYREKEEEEPLAESLIRKKFHHALSVGFKKDTIRLMLAPVLKSGKLDDDQLMKEVNDAVTAEAENRKKTKGGRDASANMLDVDLEDDDEVKTDKSKKSNKKVAVEENTVAVNALVLKEISKLSDRVGDLFSLKDDLRKLDTKVNNISNDSSRDSYANKRFIKCKSCEERRVF